MKKNQRGITLLVGLIMLVVMTLAAVMSYNLSRGNTQIVGNQQTLQITTSIAREAIDELASRDLFAATPLTAFANGTNSKSYDFNSDGTNDVVVTLDPAPCVKKIKEITVEELTSVSGEANVCANSSEQTFGVEGSSNAGCIDVVWEISAQAVDSVTAAKTTVVQGIRLRQKTGTANATNYCS